MLFRSAGELDEVVGVVGHRHELGEGGVAEDGVVGQADVRDIEVDQLGALVGLRAKGDREPHLPRRGCEALCHPREGPGGHEPLVGHLKLLEGLDRDDVEACTPINERLGDCNVVDGGGANQRDGANS